MTDSQPLVSIIIPCYNHERYVQDCIQSVIDQTYSNIELIIIDDGSKDNSIQVIESLIKECQSRFIRFEFRSRPNKGLSATLNEALEWIRGKYVASIASDDLIMPNKLSKQVSFLENNNEFVAVFGGTVLIDDNSKTVGRVLPPRRSYSFKDIILNKHNLPAPTQLIRMSAMKQTGGYKEGLLIEDWYMWLKLSSLGEIFCDEEAVSFYRKHSTNTSSDLEKMHQGRIEVLEYFRDNSLYDEALKQIYWVKHFRNFLNGNAPLRNFALICYTNPIKTTKITIRYIRKKVLSFLKVNEV